MKYHNAVNYVNKIVMETPDEDSSYKIRKYECCNIKGDLQSNNISNLHVTITCNIGGIPITVLSDSAA